MRNLKKFLALVMAMVMAFSLMVTVNAAHIGTQYTDEDDVTPAFEEAMEVLTGMGVYQGDPGATFRPASTITRAETAALIYRLATGDTTDARKDLYKDYGNFADVSSTDWFAGYVGYCANAGYIKGHGGYFNPYGQVTGYEVLAMVLRAVGYDKNHEFEGATWQTNVSALSTQLGILKQVKSTDYGDRLYEASRRDVVASLLFETAANVNMVSYSAMAGYNKYVNLINDELNPTLGQKNFGLTNTTRIVLGNQATGEKYTQMGVEADTSVTAKSDADPSKTMAATANMYLYPGETVTVTGDYKYDIPNGLKVDFKSDLTLFGHKTKVWYDARPGSTNSDGAQPTFAWFDKATLAKTVHANKAGEAINKTNADGTKDGNIAQAAANAGFTIPAASGNFYESDSFSRMTAATKDAAVTAGTYDALVWTLISNDDDKIVDVVIPVDCEIAQISEVNNIASGLNPKTIELRSSTHGTTGVVNQSDVMDPEQIKLKSTVISTKVKENTKDGTGGDPVYWFNTPYQKVTKTVVAYDWDGTTNGTQTVTCSDGTELKASIIDVAAMKSGSCNIKDRTGTGATKILANAQYEFTLDMQGNWIHAKRVYDTSFVYATYMDYSTQLGTSSFIYRMVGVDFDGQVVTKDVKSYRMDDDATTHAVNNTVATPTQLQGTNDIATLKIPFNENAANSGLVMREHDPDGVGTRTGINYKGFVISDTLADNDIDTLDPHFGIHYMDTYASDADTKIDKDSLKLTVKAVEKAAADGTAGKEYLYFTEETKFIVVDGYGTDSLKPVVYNGITELLGTAESVTIDTKAASDGSDEILYTQSGYTYANATVKSYQVDTIFIPKTSVHWDNGSNIYFVHDADSAVFVTDPNGSGAKLFTAYQGGEKTSIWVDAATAATLTGNVFVKADPSTTSTIKTAADGRTIYEVAAATTGAPGTPGTGNVGIAGATNAYVGTTNNGQTAMIKLGGTTNTAFNVANVKVVNFVDNYTVTNLAELNDLASLIESNSSYAVKVAVEYAERDSNVASAIYVLDIS